MRKMDDPRLQNPQKGDSQQQGGSAALLLQMPLNTKLKESLPDKTAQCVNRLYNTRLVSSLPVVPRALACFISLASS
jgi:hypothetical protein